MTSQISGLSRESGADSGVRHATTRRKCLWLTVPAVVALLILALTLVGCGGASAAGASGTPTPTATVAPTATPKPAFFDPLTSDTGRWSILGSHCHFASGGYQVSAGLCAVKGMLVDDGEIGVDVTVTAGPTNVGSGILYRSSTGGYYEFVIAPAGAWAFARIVGGSGSIVDSGQSSAINQGLGAKNTLKASFRGSHFEFFVNGTQVSQDDDSSLIMGVIGVTTGPGGTAVFNNFAYFA